MADKKISELDQVLQINNDAVFPMSQDNSGTDTTYKTTITQLSTEIGEGQTFSNLQTTDKTLVGAINEVAQGGGGGGSSNANIAPDYDATSTYAVGDWCIYNGTLYQCNTDIPVAEAFDPTHWTAKKVVDAFADIEDELDDKVDTADYNAELLPIESGSSTNTKSYIDSGLSGKQNKAVLNIVKTYGSGSSTDALDNIVAEYGTNNMMFSFSCPVGYFTGVMNFFSSSIGSGFLIQSATSRLWVLYYLNGAWTLTEKT